MASFVKCSVDRVKGGELAVEKNGKFRVVSYNEKDPNVPINMEFVRSFRPPIRRMYTTEDVPSFPELIFVLSDGTNVKWWYPPTVEGKEKRDSDLAMLEKMFCKNLEPVRNPLPPRPRAFDNFT